MKANIAAKSITSRRSALDKVIGALLLKTVNNDKSREIPIDSKLVSLFNKAAQDTRHILAELPARLNRALKYDDGFDRRVLEYLRLYDEFEHHGDLHKLEVLTARYDIIGAMDLLKLDLDIDALIACIFQETCLDHANSEDEVVFECYVDSDMDTTPLFIAPDVNFNELRNLYTYCRPSHGESYWISISTGWFHAPDCSYELTIQRRRLTMKEMWHEVSYALQQGHHLYDEDGEELTRQQMAQQLSASKL